MNISSSVSPPQRVGGDSLGPSHSKRLLGRLLPTAPRWPHATSVPAVATKPFPIWDSPQPSADQAPKFLQVFGKPALSLKQTFAPFTPGKPELATSGELQCRRDLELSLQRDLIHCCPSSALSPGRDSARRSSLDQVVASVSLQWPGLLRALVPSLRPPVPVTASAGAQGPVCHILGAELPPQPHTHPHCCDCALSTARAGVTTAGQLPPFPGFHTAPPSLSMSTPGHCQHEGTAHG